MITYKEKIEGCLYLSSFLETLGYFNGHWEFNYGNKIDTVKEGVIMNYFFLHEYYLRGGLNNINFQTLKSSDDTLLIIATTDALINGGGVTNYINSYLKYLPKLKEDERQSGIATLQSLEEIRLSKNINVIKYSSKYGGNGAAIRTAPIGLKYYKNYEKVCEEALLASLVTHNYALGFLGGIVTALFTAFAVNNINPFEWSLKLEEMYKNKFFNNIIEKHVKENIISDINEYFIYWEKYNEERLTKMKFRNLQVFTNASFKIQDLTTYSSIDYLGKMRGYEKFGGSGLEGPLIAYDNFLLSAIPNDKMEVDIKNPKFSWESFIFHNVFFFGDNDSTSAISGSWYGAYLGIDKFPINKIKELEFYDELKNLTNKL